MSLVELKIDRIQYSETQTGAYVLFLSETLTHKKLPIVIGGLEAHAITLGLEKNIKPQRPLTHDLMKSVMETYDIKLKKVVINKFDQGIFYALLVTEKDGKEKTIDSRTSDAVAMAVRFDAPIFCERNILEEAGIFLPDHTPEPLSRKEEEDLETDLEELLKKIDEITDENKTTEKSKQELSELEQLALALFGKKTVMFTSHEIKQMLQEAIEDEQYERAAKLKRFLELMQ